MIKKKSILSIKKGIVGLVLIVVAFGVTNFVINKVALTTDPVEAASPGWITSCQYSHSLPDDPIVSPGQAGAAHMHDFLGSKVTNTNSTAMSLQAGGTTCTMQDDKSAYWVPALFKNNVRVFPTGTNKNILIYYRGANMKSGTTFQTIPDGLKMIIGNQNATSPAENDAIAKGHIQFKCGPGSGDDRPVPPSQCNSGIMVISYIFPNCWDGVNLDSPDHLSHMSYPSGGSCPVSHPVAIPRIQAFIRYPVGTSQIGTVTMTSGPYFTAHMDFFNGWDPTAINQLVNKCINAGRDCGKDPSIPL